MTISFPRQNARTRRFTLGVPRGFQIAPDGSRVVFLRTKGGDDPVTCLWTLDVATGTERLVADPAALDVPGEDDLPAEERARRERAREQAGGIVGFVTDRDRSIAVFTLAGRLFSVDLDSAEVRPLGAVDPVFDPRPDPTGRRVAYVRDRALRVIDIASGADRAVAEPEHGLVSYGLAEFIAAEEMGRMRGYWWAPDGYALLVTRVDETPVPRRHIADPADPTAAPYEMAYPAAGAPNAEVSLTVVDLDAGTRTAVGWDVAAFPYLVTARWDRHGPLVVVQSRDQRRMRVLAVDTTFGTTEPVVEDGDPTWLEVVPGVPTRTRRGDLVWTAVRDGARRLLVGSAVVTPPELRVRSVLGVDDDTVLFTASREPTEVHVWEYTAGEPVRLTERPGVYGGCRAGGTTVLTESSLDRHDVRTRVLRGATVREIASKAETPVLTPRVELMRAGDREIRTAVLLPSWHTADAEPLPVLMDPYGGPHAQRVLAAARLFREPQWLADQGFAVVIADGRGTPARGPAWEQAVHHDLAGPVLDDQVAALHAAAERYPLDLTRVGVRGWSFGGYLAALAVLRRPDVFHAAVAGAPVTDWRLYDTHYTERYLGMPDAPGEVYDRSSLIDDAARLERPLLLIHGLADDNVAVAHTLRLSAALLEAGRPHSVLPLSGVTHMTPQEVVAENLLHLQVDFLKRSLGIA